MRIYVGNLPKNADEDDLIEIFSEYGIVRNIKIFRNISTDFSGGYALLEMPDEKAAIRAIEEWDQGSIDDQVIAVNAYKHTDVSKERKLITIIVDPSKTKKEVILDLLLNLSGLYRSIGGEGFVVRDNMDSFSQRLLEKMEARTPA